MTATLSRDMFVKVSQLLLLVMGLAKAVIAKERINVQNLLNQLNLRTCKCSWRTVPEMWDGSTKTNDQETDE